MGGERPALNPVPLTADGDAVDGGTKVLHSRTAVTSGPRRGRCRRTAHAPGHIDVYEPCLLTRQDDEAVRRVRLRRPKVAVDAYGRPLTSLAAVGGRHHQLGLLLGAQPVGCGDDPLGPVLVDELDEDLEGAVLLGGILAGVVPRDEAAQLRVVGGLAVLEGFGGPGETLEVAAPADQCDLPAAGELGPARPGADSGEKVAFAEALGDAEGGLGLAGAAGPWWAIRALAVSRAAGAKVKVVMRCSGCCAGSEGSGEGKRRRGCGGGRWRPSRRRTCGASGATRLRCL